MNERVDSAVAMTSHLLNELNAKKSEGEDISRYLFSLQELHLLKAIAVVMDYLNYGNSYDQVERIRTRAINWCIDYYGASYYSSDKPKHVLRVHPNLFDLKIPSYERLDSQPPPLDPDTNEPSTNDLSDEVTDMSTDGVDDDADACSTVSDLVSDVGIRLRDGEIRRESFPAYAEPVLIQDADLYRILDVYDELGTSAERRRISAAMQHSNTEHQMSTDYCAVEEYQYGWFSMGRAQVADEIRIRGMDLVESPIIFYLPSVMYGIACLDMAAFYCHRMVCFGKQKLAACKVALKDTEKQPNPHLLQQRQRQRQEQRPVTPVPPQGYRQPNGVVPLLRQQQSRNTAPNHVYNHPIVVASPTGYRKFATAELASQQEPSSVLAPLPEHQQAAAAAAAGRVPRQQHQPLAYVASPQPQGQSSGFLPPLHQQQTRGFPPPPRPRQQVYINQHPRYQRQEFRVPPLQHEEEEQSFIPVQYTRASAVTVMGAAKRRRMDDSDLYRRTPSPERKRTRGRWRLFPLLSGSGKKRPSRRSLPLTKAQVNFW
ncbi:hypothetical protein NQ176_g5456 [Zarea fungicola]|uniref:Uncharacterized protein n=1 Tax=Zarea fungicola TaxID=93591 RepID=A0ACC1NAS9_9HYPO|nr:hypothetical protein NQ176_g5456 [Lecanicillium fungicola]